MYAEYLTIFSSFNPQHAALDSQSTELKKPRRTPREHVVGNSAINPINVRPRDTVGYLRELFTPLEFPEDVAQRMITHVSWERGTEGHNGRLSFIGRRVLHTYLLLFLHECTLPSQTPPQNDALAPSDLLRLSSFTTGGAVEPLSRVYDDISDKLLDTYVLGEHVGGAWRLERIMRWTPAIAQLDTLKANDPSKVLHSSGLYKVRGVTVEGVIGGVFHQFVSLFRVSCQLFLCNSSPRVAPLHTEYSTHGFYHIFIGLASLKPCMKKLKRLVSDLVVGRESYFPVLILREDMGKEHRLGGHQSL